MTKKAYFYIDDVIWLFRDLARVRPKSIYDNAFIKLLKEAHDKYGMKVQLNVFLRTDFYYGGDEFYLSEMPDCYKDEFTEASDWLRFGFHSKQEFPDYPYVNATYNDVRANLEDTKKEVFRFAGEKSFAYATVPHWLPISKAGCQALYDGGIKLLCVSAGEVTPYSGDPAQLPYGHAGRLLQNRQPETALFGRGSKDETIEASISGYNHLPTEIADRIRYTLDVHKDEETGLCFKEFWVGSCLNLSTLDELEDEMKISETCGDYYCYATHEQYFYPDYFSYQPEYPAKILKAAEIMHRNKFEYIFIEDLVK